MDDSWIQLNGRYAQALTNGLPQLPIHNWRAFLRGAGLTYRSRGGQTWIRASDPGQFVYVKPLQNADGQIRADFAATLQEMALPQMHVGWLVGADLQNERDRGLLGITWSNSLQFDLFTSPDALRTLREYAEAGYRLYRVGTRQRLYNRFRVFEVLDEIAEGTPPAQVRWGLSRPASGLVSGRLQVAPAALIALPLLARNQPLGMVLYTPMATEVIAVPNSGAFVRPYHFPPWPVGTVGATLAGEGKGVYRTGVATFEKEETDATLSATVAGANELLGRMSNPALWRADDGTFDAAERWIAWTSLLQGLEAMMSMAQDWAAPSLVWDGFRALGVLQGVWAGQDFKSVEIRDLLNPDRILKCAVPHFPTPGLQQWTADVIGNWEAEVRKGFPNCTMAEALHRIQNLRNLVHGVGGGFQRRTDRLEALKLVAEAGPNLQLVADVAATWWMAVVFAPAQVFIHGRPPWRSP